jgi:hypothetical protein
MIIIYYLFALKSKMSKNYYSSLGSTNKQITSKTDTNKRFGSPNALGVGQLTRSNKLSLKNPG